MKKLISFLLTLLFVVSVTGINAYAKQIEYKDIALTEEQLRGKDAAEIIEACLAQAKEEASDNLVYRIYIPKGDYFLNSGLHIYSNTELYLDKNTTLLRNFEEGNMIKLGVKDEITEGYNGYRNIVISGGVWSSCFKGASCAMRFGHCSNILIENLTISDVRNNHHMELAAADNFTVSNCIFSGSVRENTSSSCEALQIDIIHDSSHFPAYEKFDDTPCRNVTVCNSLFNDLYAGIGTRSAVVGSYFDNIRIVNNTFSDIKEKAITCLNYVNSTISENSIINATSGIIFEHFPISNSADKLYIPNDENAVIKLADTLNSTISNNLIATNRNLSTVDCCAITVYGQLAESSVAENANAVSGRYMADGMNITGNTIYCNSSNGRGLFLTGVENSVISDNVICNNTSSDSGINGVNLCDSSFNTIQGNFIKGEYNNGISLYTGSSTGKGSKSNGFYSNTVEGVKSYGMRIAGGSTGSVKFNNQFISCGVYGIRAGNRNVTQDMGVLELKSIKRSGRGRAVLRWKALEGADGYKIYRSMTPDGGYRQIATIKGSDKELFEDKTSRPGNTYYYRISPYVSENSAVVIGYSTGEFSIKL